MDTAVGFCLANCIGNSGNFFEANIQWRFPLTLQLPCPIFFLFTSLFFLPFTPRWLIAQDRVEEARAVLVRIHPGSETERPMKILQTENEPRSEIKSPSSVIIKLLGETGGTAIS